jgi:hypothetical protein
VPKSSGTLSTKYVIVDRKYSPSFALLWPRARRRSSRAPLVDLEINESAPGSDPRAGVATPFATAVPGARYFSLAIAPSRPSTLVGDAVADWQLATKGIGGVLSADRSAKPYASFSL